MLEAAIIIATIATFMDVCPYATIDETDKLTASTSTRPEIPGPLIPPTFIAACDNIPPPWRGVPPPLVVYREREHRRLAALFHEKCWSCIWG